MEPIRIAPTLTLLAAFLHLACVEINSPTEPRGPLIVGTGPVVTETRAVSGFDGIEVVGAGELYVDLGGEETLTVTAEENLLPFIRSEVVDGRLILGPEPGIDLSGRERIVYRVTARDLRLLVPSGTSLAEVSAIDTPELEIRASGASQVRADGRADHFQLDLSGASRFVGERLRCRTVEAYLSGASLATVRVSDRLSGSLSGASTLEYYGDPTVAVTTSGSSRVRRVD